MNKVKALTIFLGSIFIFYFLFYIVLVASGIEKDLLFGTAIFMSLFLNMFVGFILLTWLEY